MDISTISSQYLNSSYVPLSSSSVPGSFNAENTGSFEDLFKRTQEAKKLSPENNGIQPALGFRKETIDKNDKLYELCMELETYLIKNLIKSMRSTVQKTKLIDTGFAGEIYEDMLYDEYAKTFSRNANLGFAEMAYKELSGQR